MGDTWTLALAGDVMLGRLVDERVRALGAPTYVWGDVLPVLQRAEVVIVNLECVIASPETGRPWRPKVFHFKAGPWAVEALKAASVEAVALANNHVLDFHEEALLEMLARLDRAGIARAGAGRNLGEAMEPAVVEGPGGRVGLVALTDNEPDWEAADEDGGRPGVFYVPVEARDERFERLCQAIEAARARADVVVVSAHVGPHYREHPGPKYRAFAQAVLEAGADVYMGSSNHIFQGVEVRAGGIILYDLGDFVDDYMVDPVLRNDWSFLFCLEFEGSQLRRLRLVPTHIRGMQVRLARGEVRGRILSRMVELCLALGTRVREEGGTLVVEAP